MKRWLGIALVLMLLLGGLLAALLQQRWERALAIDENGLFLMVEPGETLAAVAARLQAEGVYPDPWLLRLYGRATGLDQRMRHGEYLVRPGTTPAALLELLSSGLVISYQVTLPEGITLARAITLLQQEKQLERLLTGPSDPLLLTLVAPFENPEGWFFPDSYRYERGATDFDILQRANRAMRSVLEEEWAQRAPNLPYETPYEALIMASIVERETGMPSERAEIAGVFVRRLCKNMLLQTDPTIIYGLGDDYSGDLRRSHLRDAGNRYNTYRHRGLPPSPIALPGRAAIHAALNPAPGDTLFFVARGDGGHQFSVTLAEHERAVRKYQLKRREDYRSSPPPEAEAE
ncbi:endolytic transglycosylase MltG [Mangrovimicrobium sediminis]|uniref:Endolytic murein transglycosylase n=1 Tax=Mangrovimicrobium sediminis TaxID=2562682 RepID=A0A4Z0M2I6_9GAMM|nr:endolytic transglycosylase MltG [Haliea sp. SAOS-164]TGD73647.1 endolytic transglycosylase MltG [Haliea sp. SAOS-164]